MERKSKTLGIFLCGVVVFVAMFLEGCFYMPYSSTVGTPIKEDKVKMIQFGKTTKEEIIQWFGVPTQIQKPGEERAPSPKEKVVIPYGGVAGVGGDVLPDSSFELFSSKHTITEDYRIYLYTYTVSKGASVSIPFFGSSDTKSVTDKLLVLINEKTGIVEDYILSK